MKSVIASSLIGAAVMFQQVATPADAQAEGWNFQEQMRNIIENQAGKNPLQQDLYVAIWNRDVYGVKAALSRGAVPNKEMFDKAIDNSGMAVSRYPNDPSVQIYNILMTDKYMDALSTTEKSELLYRSASPGYVDAIERLIAHGADPNMVFDNMRPNMPVALAAANLLSQIKYDSGDDIANAANAVMAFVKGGTARDVVAKNVRRQDVKDQIFKIMDSVGSDIGNKPVAPRP